MIKCIDLKWTHLARFKSLVFKIVLLVSLSESVLALDEHKVNRSLAAQGQTTTISWSSFNSASRVYCGTACAYLQRSAGRLTAPAAWTLLPSTWPGVPVNSPPSPATFLNIESTPANEQKYGDPVYFNTNYWQKSQVAYTRGTRDIKASVQMSGNPTAALAYHVVVQNQASSSREFFIRLPAPKEKNYLHPATYIGGPSGEQPIAAGDNEALVRSSVEVFVDGLLVWHSANTIHRRDEVSNLYGMKQVWGEDAVNDLYYIYVGRYQPGETFILDYVVQTDVETIAEDCEDDYSSYPDTYYQRDCQVATAGRDLPSALEGKATFDIFSTSLLPMYVIPIDWDWDFKIRI